MMLCRPGRPHYSARLHDFVFKFPRSCSAALAPQNAWTYAYYSLRQTLPFSFVFCLVKMKSDYKTIYMVWR